MRSNSTMVAAAAVLAAAAVGAAYLTLGRKSEKLASSSGDCLPALTEKETLIVMRAILDKVKMMAMRMLQAADGIRVQMQQQGHEMDERKLMQTFIYQHFVDAMENIQSTVLAENDVEESELEEAVDEYARGGDVELREIVAKLKAIHYQFGGEGDAAGLQQQQEPDDTSRELGLEELLQVIDKLAERIADQMDEYIVGFKEQHGPPNASTMEEFHHGFMRLTEVIEKATMQELDLSLAAFQRAVEKHSGSPRLQMAFQQMQMVSAAKMQEHGIQ